MSSETSGGSDSQTVNRGEESMLSSNENQDARVDDLKKQRLSSDRLVNENGHSAIPSDIESKDSVFYHDDDDAMNYHDADENKPPVSPSHTPQIKSRSRKRKHIFLSSSYTDGNDISGAGNTTSALVNGQNNGSVWPPPHKKRRRRKVKGYPWGKTKKKKTVKVRKKLLIL